MEKIVRKDKTQKTTIGFTKEDKKKLMNASSKDNLPMITFIRRAALLRADKILNEMGESC